MFKKILSISLSLLSVSAFAADPVFTFAPPPVSYANSIGSLRYTLLSADFGDESLTGLGFNRIENAVPEISGQNIMTQLTGVEVDGVVDSRGYFLLNSSMVTMLAFDDGQRYQHHLDDGITAFHGYNWGVNVMSVDAGGNCLLARNISAPLTYSGGVQKKIRANESTLITPYVFGLVNASLTDSATFQYNGSSCDTDSEFDVFTTTGIVLGFDILYDGISISGMLTSSENDMVMFSMGFPIE